MLQIFTRSPKAASPARYTWDLKSRATPKLNAQIRFGRARRRAGLVFRVLRNGFAALGVCFLYLLVIGVFQYLDQPAKADIACAVGRCT